MQNKILILSLGILVFVTGNAFAYGGNNPYIVSPNGQYLGALNNNPYDPNSVSNPYGKYGSPYSSTSINNPYSQYGSPYSQYSARNPYATQAPQVYSPYGTNPYGR